MKEVFLFLTKLRGCGLREAILPVYKESLPGEINHTGKWSGERAPDAFLLLLFPSSLDPVTSQYRLPLAFQRHVPPTPLSLIFTEINVSWGFIPLELEGSFN